VTSVIQLEPELDANATAIPRDDPIKTLTPACLASAKAFRRENNPSIRVVRTRTFGQLRDPRPAGKERQSDVRVSGRMFSTIHFPVHPAPSPTFKLRGTFMRLTVVGCGDAWGTGGRGHTCFRLDSNGRVFVVDFGASAIVGWHKLGYSTNDIDAVLISHLHGDHFGGLPFLLLNAQYEARRKKPLLIIGPPGTRAKIENAVDIFYPGVLEDGWRFPWSVEELKPGSATSCLGAGVTSAPVSHGTHVQGTGLRLEADGTVFAYSGDTEWTDTLLGLSARSDLFVVECYSHEKAVVGHLNWPRLLEKLPIIEARRIAVTHMGATVRAHGEELARSGVEVLDDGRIIDF
jgi:ribonuclease BN (tRNA processing enzyme)